MGQKRFLMKKCPWGHIDQYVRDSLFHEKTFFILFLMLSSKKIFLDHSEHFRFFFTFFDQFFDALCEKSNKKQDKASISQLSDTKYI